MNKSTREAVKEYLLELDPCIKLDEENEDKLIGYAERFGGSIIPMYDGINTFLIDDMDHLIKHVNMFNSRAMKADGFEDTLIGYMNIDGYTIYLHDREKMLQKLVKEYEEDPMCEEDEGYSYYTMAIEYYEFNIIGAYMEGVPAFAVMEEEVF